MIVFGSYAIPAFVPLLIVFVLLVLDFSWNRYYSNKYHQHPLAIKAITKSLNFLTIHASALVMIVLIVTYYDLLPHGC